MFFNSLPTPSRWLSICVVAPILFVSFRSDALSSELLVNGGFTDGVTGWDSVSTDVEVAEWFLRDVGDSTPLSVIFPTSTEGNAEGVFALSDSGYDEYGEFVPNQTALFQPFSVPSESTSVLLSLDMFVNDWSGQPNYNAGQTARVDIIKADADKFSTSASAIVYNAYLGTDGGPSPNPFARREFELLPFVELGQDYLFRVMSISQEHWLNVGVDNISITAVPEPRYSTAGLLIACLAGMLPSRRTGRHVRAIRVEVD